MADDLTSVDELYALDPADFVAARNALAKRLKAAGDKEEAARVAALRRPSTVAAALNRAAREHPDLLDAALAAGQDLRVATEAALDGDASRLRTATAAERTASDRFLAAAAPHAGGAAPEPRLAATLRAAVVDEAVADELRRGVLSTDHQASGFGFATGFDADPTPAPRKPPAKKRAAVKDALKPSPSERKAAAEAEKAQRERVAEEERQRFAARRQRAEQEREVERLERSAERLALRADAAETAAADARAKADAAAVTAAEARAALDGEA